MQLHRSWSPDGIRILSIPDENDEVMQGVLWGPLGGVPSAAYWATLAFEHSEDSEYRFDLSGRSLKEEVAFCLLGGHGMPAEIGWAAYNRVKSRRLLHCEASEQDIRDALFERLEIGDRRVRYRFYNVKSRQLAAALSGLETINADVPDQILRDALTTLPGIGLKTASWILRNMRGSNEVAIIDVHILRACRRLGIFSPESDIARDYLVLEDRFLEFARGIGVASSYLDLLMWEYARRHPRLSA